MKYLYFIIALLFLKQTYANSVSCEFEEVYKDGSILAGKVLASIQNSELKVSDATIQENERGKYWKVIPDDKMKAVRYDLNTV